MALSLIAATACEPPQRTDGAARPRTAAVLADPGGAANRGDPPTKQGALHSSKAEPTASPPAATEAPAPAAAPAAAACPAGRTCDYAAWDRVPRPAIEEIFVQKGPHRLHLVAGGAILRTYSVALGWGGMGPKKYEGDGVTPTGTYAITDKIPSKWHTFLGVSYPSLEDQRAFPLRRARGEVPPGRGIGFGIALHGHAKTQEDGAHKKEDWTLGCIALDNGEIDEVASVVKRGTRIVITD